LTFKAALAEGLPELIPEEVDIKLRARGLDVQRIAENAPEADSLRGSCFDWRKRAN
jgi:hypothetical protein